MRLPVSAWAALGLCVVSLALGGALLLHARRSVPAAAAQVATATTPADLGFRCDDAYQGTNYAYAVAICRAVLDADPSDMLAHYWRGVAYRAWGRADEALQDFTTVANSGDSTRASAAIAISMVYFDRGDLRGALHALDSYSYLYDPNVTAAENVAVAYNNRCYAYMQLGELHRALHQCDESLKYGQVPDAIQKRRELLQRLGPAAANE
jgi:tetratricopeptide (TPR) repeat protein